MTQHTPGVAAVQQAAAQPFQGAFAAGGQGAGVCTHFQQKSTNCNQNCGMCFNPGSRSGAMCKGDSPGYHCPSDSPPAGGDMAFACMDWTFGSTAQLAAEASYNSRSGQPPVYFGVGTYGNVKDRQRGLGMCVLLEVDSVDRKILAQSINTGSDVSGNQFDLQIGAGGAGAFNTCAGGTASNSMYPGSREVWGHQYGGLDSRKECAGLPPYPHDGAAMQAAGDSLVKLCEYGFEKGVRGELGTENWKALGNPSILSITRVACPTELVNLTQLHRSDDPPESQPGPTLRAEHLCQAGVPGGPLDWCLTRMMDCRLPSGGFKDNIVEELVLPGHKLVQPCLSDGYTRIDWQCGCWDCYC